ncbi:MAG: hypothetical protein R2747_09865 [Pyrinomonadaceae bacterium]
MKKAFYWILKKAFFSAIFLSTFAASTIFFHSYPLFWPVPFHQVAQNAEIYRLTDVKIKGELEVSGTKAKDLGIFQIGDLGEKLFTGASLDLEQARVSEEFYRLVDELAEKNDSLGEDLYEKGFYTAGIEVVGEIEKTKGCFAPPFFVKAKEIRQTGPIRFVSREELERAFPDSNRGSEVRE